MNKFDYFDEMHGVDGKLTRPAYQLYSDWYKSEDVTRLRKKQKESERLFRLTGITFNVYGDEKAEERLIPFDIVPRILSGREWARLSQGIRQRVGAINAFLHDIYHKQEIVKAGRVPIDLISNNEAFLPEMLGVNPAGKVYTHVVGIDLVRTGPDEFYVLEDNARTPSGVSYMLENRETMLQMFPELFAANRVVPISNYPALLHQSLSESAPAWIDDNPTIALLTPGTFNSAYYEHSFLADKMGIELVESHDLQVVDGSVAMRTTKGYTPIDVLYRRVDDYYLDPLNFNPESQLGVPGIFDVYRATISI